MAQSYTFYTFCFSLVFVSLSWQCEAQVISKDLTIEDNHQYILKILKQIEEIIKDKEFGRIITAPTSISQDSSIEKDYSKYINEKEKSSELDKVGTSSTDSYVNSNTDKSLKYEIEEQEEMSGDTRRRLKGFNWFKWPKWGRSGSGVSFKTPNIEFSPEISFGNNQES